MRPKPVISGIMPCSSSGWQSKRPAKSRPGAGVVGRTSLRRIGRSMTPPQPFPFPTGERLVRRLESSAGLRGRFPERLPSPAGMAVVWRRRGVSPSPASWPFRWCRAATRLYRRLKALAVVMRARIDRPGTVARALRAPPPPSPNRWPSPHGRGRPRAWLHAPRRRAPLRR